MSNPHISVYIQRVLDAAPTLTEEKRRKITTLLVGGDAK